jgi:hypothetical protein
MLSIFVFSSIAMLAASAIVNEQFHVTSLDDFPFDRNSRLSSSFVLYSEKGCEVDWHAMGNLKHGIMSPGMVDFFGFDNVGEFDCRAVCVFQGAPKHLLHAVFDSQRYDGSINQGEWLNTMRTKERGWISYYPSDLFIYWVDEETGGRRMVALLSPGEKNTVWLNSLIGHTFVIHNSKTDELIASTNVLFDGLQIIGEVTRPDSADTPQPEQVPTGVKDTLSREFDRSYLVQRTFTSLGFDTGRLPDDIFCSMLTYYYNNYANAYLEEWVGMYHVNWWEADNW